MTRKKPGTVWLVGAGPGDPGLLTGRGAELLAAADVVLHDALIHPALLARAVRARAIVEVGKRAGGRATPQATINRLMIRHARAGRMVVRLKGGDPFMFGRGGEECEALDAARIPFGVVPGVSSALAGPAAAGIPLTHRNVAASVTIVTGRTSGDVNRPAVDWEGLARSTDTLVIMMGTWEIAEIARRLIAAGRVPATPIVAIQWATWPQQRTVRATLGTAAKAFAGLAPPTVMIAGTVAGIRRTAAHVQHAGPLAGVRIAVARPAEDAGEDAARLQRLGAIAIPTPAIAIRPLPPPARGNSPLDRLDSFDWIVLTSANAAVEFGAALAHRGLDGRRCSRARIAAIGPGTARALREHAGLEVDLVPVRSVAEGLVQALAHVHGKKILIPRARIARDVLPRELARRGNRVTILPLYETVPDQGGLSRLRSLVLGRGLDVVVFASGSAVDAVMTALGAAGRRVFAKSIRAASIGPVTSAALRRHGIRTAMQAKQPTMEGLAAAIVSYYRKHPHGH